MYSNNMSRDHTHSQHFLRSPKIVAELIGHSNIRKNDLVYDLGAGSGVITSVLAKRCRHVVAVELEPKALATLKRNVTDLSNVTIIKKDILQIEAPQEPYKIFANIPFHISAPIVRMLTSAQNPPKSIYLITQKQFAKKLVPGQDHFTSQLSAEIGAFFTVRIRRPLRKTDFTPPPAVDTVLLEIKPREEFLIPREQMTAYQDFVKQSFSSQPFFQKLPRVKLGISPELRPSQLSLEQLRDLYFAYKKQ